MLKKISPLLSADLLKILYEMGHGDEIAIVDANYAAASCKAAHYVTLPGISSVDILDAVLDIFPVDTYVETPFHLMEVVPGDTTIPVVWEKYKSVLEKYGFSKKHIGYIDRFGYYDYCNKVYCVISSGERLLYGNITIKKGVLKIDE